MSDAKAVEIDAEVRQVRTMADGTVNIVLNLPEYAIPQAAVVMGWVGRMVRGVLEVVEASEAKPVMGGRLKR